MVGGCLGKSHSYLLFACSHLVKDSPFVFVAAGEMAEGEAGDL